MIKTVFFSHTIDKNGLLSPPLSHTIGHHTLLMHFFAPVFARWVTRLNLST